MFMKKAISVLLLVGKASFMPMWMEKNSSCRRETPVLSLPGHHIVLKIGVKTAR